MAQDIRVVSEDGRGRLAAAAGRAWNRIETLALLALGLAQGAAYALAQPAYSTGDEMPHMDYAYDVWHGRLPSFFQGLTIDPGVGYRPGLQWVEQHPPLFYAFLAPFVGPLYDAGHPVDANMAARAALVVMGAISVLAVRWMVRQGFPLHPRAATIAALLYALSSWYPRQSGAIYNDLPAVLAITVATGYLFKAMRHPERRGPVVGLVIALAAASLVRFSALPLAAGLLAALFVHRLVVRRSLRAAIVQPALAVLGIVVASGWWYLRNRERTGNLQGSRADFWTQERGWETKTVGEVVQSDFWRTMLQQFFSTTFLKPREDWFGRAELGIYGLLLLPLALGLVAAVVLVARSRRDRLTDLLVVLTLVGVTFTVVATQIDYTMSSGSSLPRYFFALIPPVAALMALAFSRWRISAVLLVVWLAVRIWCLAIETQSTMDRPIRGDQAEIYPPWVWTFYGVAVATTVLVAFCALRRPRELTPDVEPPAVDDRDDAPQPVPVG